MLFVSFAEMLNNVCILIVHNICVPKHHLRRLFKMANSGLSNIVGLRVVSGGRNLDFEKNFV